MKSDTLYKAPRYFATIIQRILPFACFCILAALPVFAAETMEKIAFSDDGTRREVEGRILKEYSNAIILQGRDGQNWVIKSENLSHREKTGAEFKPFTPKELEEELLKEFPKSAGFDVLQSRSKRYVIVYNTSRAYAAWAGMLFDRLAVDYPKFWGRRGFELNKNEFPLVAVIFSDSALFRRYAIHDTGMENIDMIAAYYNKLTNRMILRDLVGLEKYLAPNASDSKRKLRRAQLAELLDRPGAAHNIATIIHEATHQIGFNCGMHDRLAMAAYPLWLCEGFAVFHEVPDRDADVGWSVKVKINDLRLPVLLKFFARQSQNPLPMIVQDDSLLRKGETAAYGYALAWGLTFYLSQSKDRKEQFFKYLKKMGEKDADSKDSPEIRKKDFEECFGDDWDKLYVDFVRYIKTLPSR